MKRQKRIIAFATALLMTLASAGVLAQQPLDRTKVPTPGANPTLTVPAWTKTQLANGATLIVSERRGLPSISFSFTLHGGSNQFEPAAKRGVAAMTASMLTEGTRPEPAISSLTPCRCSVPTSTQTSARKTDRSVLFRLRRTSTRRWRSLRT